jgi:hypothetical protein
MNSRKQAMMDMQDKKYQPFPRSVILTMIFVVLSSRLEAVVDVFANTIDMIELESFGSTALGSTVGFEIEAVCG